MREISVILLASLAFASPSVARSQAGEAISLLPGYQFKNEPGTDVVAWTIERPGGVIIHFEAGPSEDPEVSDKNKASYDWYREQTVNGHIALFALAKRAPKPATRSDPNQDSQRRVLLVTFPLGGFGGTGHVANFVAEIKSQTDLADALLMILTFDPTKGSF